MRIPAWSPVRGRAAVGGRGLSPRLGGGGAERRWAGTELGLCSAVYRAQSPNLGCQGGAGGEEAAARAL